MAANEVHAVCIDAYCVAMFARAITRVFILYIYMCVIICLSLVEKYLHKRKLNKITVFLLLL